MAYPRRTPTFVITINLFIFSNYYRCRCVSVGPMFGVSVLHSSPPFDFTALLPPFYAYSLFFIKCFYFSSAFFSPHPDVIKPVVPSLVILIPDNYFPPPLESSGEPNRLCYLQSSLAAPHLSTRTYSLNVSIFSMVYPPIVTRLKLSKL